MDKTKLLVSIILTLILLTSVAFAGKADVLYVYLDEDGGYYDISVVVRHADSGWDHFANWWRVRTEDGKELARRELAHPHVDEQPFERELFKSIRIPDYVKVIFVEAHDLVHGYGGKAIRIDLGAIKGAGYEIRRR